MLLPALLAVHTFLRAVTLVVLIGAILLEAEGVVGQVAGQAEDATVVTVARRAPLT